MVAEETDALDADSVYGRLEAKMIARHPHLFGNGERRGWEELKAEERADGESVLSGLPKGLDPLTKAYRIQQLVAGVGFDWESYHGAAAKVAEELEEVRDALREGNAERPSGASAGGASAAGAETERDVAGTTPGSDDDTGVSPTHDAVEEELGDLLFAVVNLSRLAGPHPTTALARANVKFQDRFQRLEALARERGITFGDADLATLDGLWEEIKNGGQ